VSICAAHGVVLTWAPDFPGVFPMGLQTEQYGSSPVSVG
jgi:hypothetical protein